MKFSLLTPPTDAPSRIPLTRGLPSAQALAVNTSGMPNVLPLASMDVEAVTTPYKALARFAATGGEVSGQAFAIVMHAEEKKREAEDLIATNTLLANAAMEVNDKYDKLKTSTDHNTLPPAFNQMWKETTQDAVAKAPNARVAKDLSVKLLQLQVVKSGEVSAETTRKRLNYYEASLETTASDFAKVIADPATTEANRDLAVKNVESYFLGYGKMGVSPERIEAVRRRTLTGAYNNVARHEMTQNPEQFLPKTDENPDGGDGWKKFGATGKYPADPNYLTGLIDTTGPNIITRRNAEVRRQRERTEADHQKFYEQSWGDRWDKLSDELDSGDPARVNAASVEADTLLREGTMGPFWTHEMKRSLRQRLANTRKAGGTTDDAVYNGLETRLLEDPRSVSEDEIRRHGGVNLASSGDRSAASLILQKRQLLKADDISQRPDYQEGQKQIVLLRAGATEFLSLYGPTRPSNLPANIKKNLDLYSAAIAEYDRESRKPEWKDKNLMDLGVQIYKKYVPQIYTGGGDVTQ